MFLVSTYLRDSSLALLLCPRQLTRLLLSPLFLLPPGPLCKRPVESYRRYRIPIERPKNPLPTWPDERSNETESGARLRVRPSGEWSSKSHAGRAAPWSAARVSLMTTRTKHMQNRTIPADDSQGRLQ